MHRLPSTLGRLTAAAMVATVGLILGPGPARSQQPAAPQTKEEPLIVAPGDTPLKKQVRPAPIANPPVNVRVEILRQAAQVPAQPFIVPMANQAAPPASTIQQLRPTFQRELALLTSAAQPTTSQRREIALEAARTLRAYLVTTGQIAFNNNGAPVNQNFRMVGASFDPRKIVRQHLELAAWSKLTNVQSARYRTEVDRKERDRREVVVLNVVTTLDKHLGLNNDQRERICEVLRTSWDDRDYPPVVTAVNYDQFVAIVPPLYVAPILTEEQRKVWTGLRKVHLATVRGFEPVNPALDVEVPDEGDEDVKAAMTEMTRE